MVINRKLKSLRSFYDINQSVLAKLIEVTPNTYSTKERGIAPFNQIEMIKITEFFRESEPNLTMDDIFFNKRVTVSVTEKGQAKEQKEVIPWQHITSMHTKA